MGTTTTTTSIEEELRHALGAWGAHDRDDAFPLYRAALAAGPVHAVTLATGHSAYLVVGYEAAKSALNDLRFSKDMQAAFASGDDVLAEGLPGRDYARHLLAVDPPEHTRLRKLIAGAFSMRRVEALTPHIQDIVDELLDQIAADGPDATVDLVSRFAFPLPFTVICELLGVAPKDRARLGAGLLAMLAPTSTPEEWATSKAASDAVMAQLAELVERARTAPADDLVSDLVAARDENGPLEHYELLATIFQLIVAGHDTTSSLIGNSVVSLLRHPEQLAWLRADLDRLPAAVEELLRFDPPVPHATFRFASEDVDFYGCTIPAGAQVLICLAAANHDPARFDDPERLELGREDTRHIGLGHGIHFCVGAALARLEGRIALGSLFTRFPDLRLAVDESALHWGHGDGLVLRGLTELPVIPGSH